MGSLLKIGFVALILNSGWSLSAYAGLGEEVSPSQVPPSVCMLSLETLTLPSGALSLQSTCSGIMISPTQLLTAGHCVENIDLKKAQVHCPLNAEPQKIQNVVPAPDFKPKIVTFHEEERWRDLAIVNLSKPIHTPLASLIQSEEQIQKVLSHPKECAFFGFSTRLGSELKVRMLAQGIRLSPEAIRISESKTIWIDGQAQPVSLVGLGDSGGGLACLQNQEWIFFGITSARDYNYGGIFANIGAHQNFIKSIRSGPGITSAYTKNKVRKLQASLLAAEEEKCWKQLEDKISLRPSQTCAQAKMDFIKTQIGKKLKVKPYSEILVNGQPMSTVDHRFTQFSITKIEGSNAIGDLNLLGDSEGFGCLSRFLCRQGVYPNTRIPLDRLELN